MRFIPFVLFGAWATAMILFSLPSNDGKIEQAEIHEAFLMCNNAGGVRSITVSAAADGDVPPGHTSRHVSARCVNGMTASKTIHLQILTGERLL